MDTDTTLRGLLTRPPGDPNRMVVISITGGTFHGRVKGVADGWVAFQRRVPANRNRWDYEAAHIRLSAITAIHFPAEGDVD